MKKDKFSMFSISMDWNRKNNYTIIYQQRMGCGVTANKAIQTNQTNTVLSLNKIYERKELIGSGSYGHVYRCINKLTNLQYALKVVEITAKNKEEAIKQISNLKAQIGVLKKLNHPNIVKYYSFDISENNKQVEIVLQYAKQGSLKTYLQKHGPLAQLQASAYTSQILEGLRYLHQQNIVHRDLKCANILIMEDGRLKITDFGTAKHIKIESHDQIAQLCASLKGTPYYMAPQILRRTGHSISADVWSLGCLLIEILTGKAPWTSLTNNFEEIISYIVSGIQPPSPKGLTEECEYFLASCLDNIPSQRLTAKQLLKHRWIDRLAITSKKSINDIKYKYSSGSNTNDEVEQYSRQITNKREKRDNKYKEIQNYITQRNNVEKLKHGNYRESAKSKKDRTATKILADSPRCNQVEQIEIIPSVPLSRKLFEDQNDLKESNQIRKKKYSKNIKTAPQVKLPQIIISELNQFDKELEVVAEDLYKKDKQPQVPVLQAVSALQASIRLKTEQMPLTGFIDTAIAREQRNRYLEKQKQLRQQREEQKRRWQQQLKEGANYLRKQITSRYIL